MRKRSAEALGAASASNSKDRDFISPITPKNRCLANRGSIILNLYMTRITPYIMRITPYITNIIRKDGHKNDICYSHRPHL